MITLLPLRCPIFFFIKIPKNRVKTVLNHTLRLHIIIFSPKFTLGPVSVGPALVGRWIFFKRLSWLGGWCVFQFRFLHVILYSAERSWSHAMEKRQLPNGPNASQRIYLIGRLRKAVKWATLFSQLCAIKADSRTSLEAEVCLLISYCNQNMWQHFFYIKLFFC